jgi:hypothetical protein
MAKGPDLKKTESEVKPEAESQEEISARANRAKTGKVLVLNTAFNVHDTVTLEKGKRLQSISADYHLVVSSHPEALKKISEGMFELTEPVRVSRKKELPVGTVLDPVADKWIIDRIKAKHAEDSGALKEIIAITK